MDPAGAGASSTNQVGSIRAADQPINRGRAGQVTCAREGAAVIGPGIERREEGRGEVEIRREGEGTRAARRASQPRL